MIVVKVELWSAVTGKKTPLYNLVICNDGQSRDPNVSDYDVAVGRRGEADPVHVWRSSKKRGRVERHHRLSSHVLNLVSKALKAVNFG